MKKIFSNIALFVVVIVGAAILGFGAAAILGPGPLKSDNSDIDAEPPRPNIFIDLQQNEQPDEDAAPTEQPEPDVD